MTRTGIIILALTAAASTGLPAALHHEPGESGKGAVASSIGMETMLRPLRNLLSFGHALTQRSPQG